LGQTATDSQPQPGAAAFAAYLHKWLVLFTQHALPLLDEIDIARASQDSEKIKRAAHQLKSSCSSLGMRIASQLCAQLEQQPLSAPLPDRQHCV
ncbi:Hpt domain-containing protein, partial [Escherichia sp. TWPC-MK]